MVRRNVRLRSPQLRSAALDLYRTARQSGQSVREAARIAGLSPTTAWRYQRRLAAGGAAALKDRPRPGRPSAASRLELSTLTVELMRQHRLSTWTKSPGTAVRRTVEDPRCCRADARRLLPFTRRGQAMPAELGRLLQVKKVVLQKLVCGPVSKILRQARS